MHGVDVLDDLLALRGGQRFDLVVEVAHPVVDVHAELVEHLLVLGEGFLVERLDRVAEHDGVRHLHHRRLDVQREHHAGLVGVLDLLLEEVAQRLATHEHAVDDVALVQRNLGFEHDGFAGPSVFGAGLQHHLDLARLVEGQRLLAVVEVTTLHGRDVGTRRLRPVAHAVRMFPGELLDRLGSSAIRIAFAQNGVDGTAEDLRVAILDRLLLVVLRMARIVRQVIAFGLQLLDDGHQLRHRGADVRQLDDVGGRVLRELTQPSEVVRHALLVGQAVGELRQDARSHRDITGLDVDPGRLGERPDDRQEGVGRQQRRLVRQRVDDRRLLVAHVVFSRPVVSAISIASVTNLRVPEYGDICPMPS